MATFTSLTGIGVDSDWLFAGLRGGSFTTVMHTSDTFTIEYDNDGLPGANLRVSFVGNGFTYNGSDLPTGGTFNEISLSTSTQIPVQLATLTGLGPTGLTAFNSATLADTLLSGDDTFTGNAGNDILNGHGGQDTFVGNAGNDTFVVNGNAHGSVIHGSAANGSGGAGETDTIRFTSSTGGSFSLNSGSTNIDAVEFATGGGSTFYYSLTSANLGGLSPTLAVTGNAQVNSLNIDATVAGVFDYSGFTFSNWSQSDQVVLQDGSGLGADTIIGTNAGDLIQSAGGADTLIGKGGNDIFQLSGISSAVAIHGANADGTGGAGEINLIDPGSGERDLRTVTMSNIDGFFFANSAHLSFDPATGAIDGSLVGVPIVDADQFGAELDVNLFIDGYAVGNQPAPPKVAAIQVVDANNFNASGWQPGYIDPSSMLHISGTLGGDNVTGWNLVDVITLGAGHDTASGGAGNDFLYGGLGNDTASGGMGNDSLHGGANNDKLFGSSGSDQLLGDAGIDVLSGGLGRDILTGGADRDFFDFNSIKETKKGAARDIITDFQRGIDDIDLKGIDAKTGVKGNQKFKFIGKSDFHDKKGELHFKDAGAHIRVEGDVNGDGKADFQILVHNVNGLSAGDFLL